MQNITNPMAALITDVSRSSDEDSAVKFFFSGEELEVTLSAEDIDSDLDRLVGKDWGQVVALAHSRLKSFSTMSTREMMPQGGSASDRLLDEDALQELIQNQSGNGFTLSFIAQSQLVGRASWELTFGSYDDLRVAGGLSFRELMADYRELAAGGAANGC